MKRRDQKELLEKLSEKYIIHVKRVEVGKVEDIIVYLFDEDPEFIQGEVGLYPFLGGNFVDSLPDVVVDMGAIPFVCNGADVMAPGIINLGEFSMGDLVVVRDVTHGKALAIGVANKSSEDIIASKKGKVVKNLHYVGDKLWESLS